MYVYSLHRIRMDVECIAVHFNLKSPKSLQSHSLEELYPLSGTALMKNRRLVNGLWQHFSITLRSIECLTK
jgi:hypothetical protein